MALNNYTSGMETQNKATWAKNYDYYIRVEIRLHYALVLGLPTKTKAFLSLTLLLVQADGSSKSQNLANQKINLATSTIGHIHIRFCMDNFRIKRLNVKCA